MKKILLTSLLLSGPALFCMDSNDATLENIDSSSQQLTIPQIFNATTLVLNRTTHTVLGRRATVERLLQNIDILGNNVSIGQSALLGALPANQKEWQVLFSAVSQINMQDFLDNLMNQVLATLGEVDPEFYTPLYDFSNSIKGYYADFMKCETDEEIEALLEKIKTNKNAIINNFNQCSPVIMALGHICVKATFNYCLQGMPDDIKGYLPAAGAAAQLALTSFQQAGYSENLQLPDMMKTMRIVMKALSNGYLTKTLYGVEATLGNYIQISPKIHRGVYFVEQCAKIFLPSMRQETLMLTYSPKVKIAFPLNDGYFNNATFEDMGKRAFGGDLDFIKVFAETYPTLLCTEDDKGQNILGYAITGYCAGKDEAWHVISYLLDNDSLITKQTLSLLKADSLDRDPVKKAERNRRKQQVDLAIQEREEAYSENPDMFCRFAPQPTQPAAAQQAQSESCCVS